jgi:hypothetical protein
MTEKDNAAGLKPDGVSDLRSTASVAHTLSDLRTDVLRCSDCGQPALVVVAISPKYALCDHHAGQVLPKRRCRYCRDLAIVAFSTSGYFCEPHGREAWLERLYRLAQIRALTNDPDKVKSLVDKVGQGRFIAYDAGYGQTARYAFGHLRSKVHRYGLLRCDRCASTWVGVEYELCRNCVDSGGGHD